MHSKVGGIIAEQLETIINNYVLIYYVVCACLCASDHKIKTTYSYISITRCHFRECPSTISCAYLVCANRGCRRHFRVRHVFCVSHLFCVWETLAFPTSVPPPAKWSAASSSNIVTAITISHTPNIRPRSQNTSRTKRASSRPVHRNRHRHRRRCNNSSRPFRRWRRITTTSASRKVTCDHGLQCTPAAVAVAADTADRNSNAIIRSRPATIRCFATTAAAVK